MQNSKQEPVGESTFCIASKPTLMALPPLLKAQAYFMPINFAKACSPCRRKFSSQLFSAALKVTALEYARISEPEPAGEGKRCIAS